MQKRPSSSTKAAKLRSRAEAHLREQKKLKTGVAKTGADSRRLLHELQVHQIELEMQNAELRQARDELEVALENYTDLYDFAPSGYFTFAANGVILRANLTGATLGRNRNHCRSISSGVPVNPATGRWKSMAGWSAPRAATGAGSVPGGSGCASKLKGRNPLKSPASEPVFFAACGCGRQPGLSDQRELAPGETPSPISTAPRQAVPAGAARNVLPHISRPARAKSPHRLNPGVAAWPRPDFLASTLASELCRDWHLQNRESPSREMVPAPPDQPRSGTMPSPCRSIP